MQHWPKEWRYFEGYTIQMIWVDWSRSMEKRQSTFGARSNATDSTVLTGGYFHPYPNRKKDSSRFQQICAGISLTLWSIRSIIIPIILRNVKLNYVNDTTFKKVHVRLYETDLGDQSSEETEKCYCRSKDSCLKKGLFDLTKCMGVPIYATLPHFLRTDESYMKQIDGLTPDEVKHGLRVYFEPVCTTGLVS